MVERKGSPGCVQTIPPYSKKGCAAIQIKMYDLFEFGIKSNLTKDTKMM
jgi:hypothetical protein